MSAATQRVAPDESATSDADALHKDPAARVVETSTLAKPPLPVLAELVPPVLAELLPRRIHHPLVRLLRAVALATEWCFGLSALVLGLAILATIPVLQLLSLGYLLEVSGRVARSGRLRDGFVGIRKAARVGTIVFCTWLLLWPVRLVSDLWTDARLIDPTSRPSSTLGVLFVVLLGLVLGHVAAACLRGGRLRHFLWPGPVRTARLVFARGAYARARDGVWDFVVGLRVPYYFWLGLRGFAGTLIWLAIPVTLLALGREAPVLGVLGALLLAAVVLWLPLLQTHFAREGRLRALFAVRAIRRQYTRAPLAWVMAIALALLLSLPLYVLKIELIPREVAWLPSGLFVLSILPARLAAGWAYARSSRRDERRHWILRHAGRLALVPLAGFYVLVVFFTQFLSWYGIWSLYEQHAFLLPVPFLGM